MTLPAFIIATCPAGDVVGWSSPRAPEYFREQFVANARDQGYRLEVGEVVPPRVDLRCEHGRAPAPQRST